MMENHEKNIDDLFREELGGYTETPPPAVWDSLQKKLAKTPQGLRWSDRRIWYVAILCLILMLSIPAIRNLTPLGQSGNKTVASNENALTSAANNEAPSVKGTDNANATAENNQPSNNNTPDAQQTGNTNPKNSGNDNTKTNTPATPANKANNASAVTGTRSTKGENISDKKTQNKSAAAAKTQSHNKRKSGGKNTNNTFNNAIASSSVVNRSTQPEHIYNSSLSKPAPAEEVASETNAASTPAKDNDANTTAKPQAANNNTATNNKAPYKNEPKKMPKPEFDRWEAGVKAGYERGFDNDGSKKAVVSPYLQFNLSPKFAIMTQPAYKYASLDSRRIGNTRTYYKENSDSSVTQNGKSIPLPLEPSGLAYVTYFTYSQTS